MKLKAAMDEQDFQQVVLDGTEQTQKAVTDLTADFGRLSTETKKAFEDITKLKETANTSDSDLKKLARRIGDIDTLLRQEHRAAYGNPLARLAANDELRELVNARVRVLTSDNAGDMVRLVRNSFSKETVARAIGEDTSPGSTLINQQLYQEIYNTLATYGIWRTLGVRKLGTKVTKFPVKTARAVAQFITTEAGTIGDDSNKTGNQVSLTVLELAVLLNVSMQLLMDAEFDVTADVLDDFAEAMALRLDVMSFTANANNNGNEGGFTGLFNGGTSSVAAAGGTTVEALAEDDVRNTMLAVDPVVLTRQAKWWIHPQMLVRLLGIKDRNGRAIFLNALEAPTPSGIGTIYGYPVITGFALPNTNAANGQVAAFGDPNGYVVGIRQDFDFQSSDHFRWNTNERSFRAIARAAGGIRRATAFGVLTLAAA
jgi:HK97 family phage major capsid protein